MRTNQTTIDSIRKLRVRRSGSTLPDLTHLINEDEAETLGVTQAWKAAVVESKTRSMVESTAAEQNDAPTASAQQSPPQQTTPEPTPTVPFVQPASTNEPETAELAAEPTHEVVVPAAPELLDEDSHDVTPTLQIGEAVKQFVGQPVVKKAAYYSAIVLGAMTFFFILDPHGKSTATPETESDVIAEQEPLHSEPLVEAESPIVEDTTIAEMDEQPVIDIPTDSMAIEATDSADVDPASDTSLLDELGPPDDANELMTSLRSQQMAQPEQDSFRQPEPTPEPAYEQFPVQEYQAEQPDDRQYSDFQPNDLIQEDDRTTYQPPQQGLRDERHEPVLNAPLTETAPRQPVYEETRPETFAYPIDAIPKAISLLRGNRRLR